MTISSLKHGKNKKEVDSLATTNILELKLHLRYLLPRLINSLSLSSSLPTGY